MTATTLTPVTEEEYAARYGPEDRVELVDGEVVPKYGLYGPLTPVGNLHSVVVVDLVLALGVYVRGRKLGRVFTDPATFVISEAPKRIRCPDVAFVSAERLPNRITTDGYFRFAPDLVAEVISPSEPRAYTERKIAQYLEAGVRLVWRIDPRRLDAVAYRPGGTMARLQESDVLDGGDVVPGFTMPLTDLFAGITPG